MISTIIFDIGQVLVDFNWESYIKNFGFTEEITERLKNATVLSPLWKEQDRGKYNLEELIQMHSKEDVEIENHVRIFFENIKDIVSERAYSPILIKHLKEKGYRVYLLSNYGEYAFNIAKKNFKFLDYVDGGIISYQVHSVKPEHEIYECLISKYSLIPDECVFIDDLPQNIEEGKKQGFKCILFTTIEQVLEELNGLDINVKGAVKKLP